MQTILEILDKCSEYFAGKGIPDPKADAQLLLSHALGCKRLDLFLRFDEPMGEERLAAFRQMVRRRARREPLQHIIGSVEFFGITLKCDARALVPRNETETLCEIITQEIFPDSEAGIKILDLGTGSGAIALALSSHYKNSETEAVDNNPEALALAGENLEGLGGLSGRVRIYESDWLENVGGTFNLIVANPPYLSADEVASAEPEVARFDPASALISADSGLADLKKIIAASPARLCPGGILACECGLGQAEKLCPFALSSGFAESFSMPDMSRRQRFLICKI